MAATSVCQIANTVFGNVAVKVFSCTVGADTTMAFHTGMGQVLYHVWAPASVTTNENIECRKNEIADGTVTSGYISVTGCTDGDDVTVMVFAKH